MSQSSTGSWIAPSPQTAHVHWYVQPSEQLCRSGPSHSSVVGGSDAEFGPAVASPQNGQKHGMPCEPHSASEQSELGDPISHVSYGAEMIPSPHVAAASGQAPAAVGALM